MFGADHLAAGKLSVASPPMRDHFQTWSIINDGRWYSKVTVGWPLLLALGRSVDLAFLVNPILAAFCIVLLFLIGNSLHGVDGGLLAALWGLTTPFFLMLSGTYFPHTATALFSLLFIYLLIRTFETDRWLFPVLAGLSMAFSLLVRPADAAVLFLGLAPMMGYLFLRSKERRRAALKIAVIAVIVLAGAGLLLVINQVQNGAPFLFGYQKYRPDERWGFGPNGHTLLKGLWHTAYSLMRAGAWGVPFIGLFTVISLFVKKWSTRLLLVPVLGSMALYAGYYTLATFEIGPRYYLPLYLLALVPASGGAILVRDALARRRAPCARTFVPALALATFLFAAIGLWPGLVASVKAQTPTLAKVSRLLDDPPVEPRSVIFLRDHMYLKNTFLTRNFPDYIDSRHIFVLYLMPDDNKKLMELFPSRNFYMTAVNPISGDLDFVPYVDNAETAANYLAAGLNFVEFDPRQAVRAFAKALETAPGEPTIMMNLARSYDLEGDKGSAVAMYAQVLQSGDASLSDMALFFMATDLRELGETSEALKVYRELAGIGRDPAYRGKAAAWVEKLTPR
jgi:tetratricopeptide (TPR) repeat protein